jgi:SulP family sulfate permease
VGACVLLFAGRRLRLPGTLIVLAGGVAGGLTVAGGLPHVDWGPQSVGLSLPNGHAFAIALTTLVLAQLPLTFGNSVVATADAERSYFGQRAARVRPNRLAASIGLTNLATGLAHGLPLCHGAGGVTAHYKLGARTAAATASVGALYLALALAFGASLPAVLQLLLPGALAGMLLYVAIQHGVLASQLESALDRVIAAGVGVITLLSGNLAIGFGAGAAVVLARWALERLRRGAPAPAA